jgi:hypothetical protein
MDTYEVELEPTEPDGFAAGTQAAAGGVPLGVAAAAPVTFTAAAPRNNNRHMWWSSIAGPGRATRCPCCSHGPQHCCLQPCCQPCRQSRRS